MCFLVVKSKVKTDDYVESGLLKETSICDPSFLESAPPVNEPKVIPI